MKAYASGMAQVVALIGDLVGSRRSGDRRAVHDALTTAIATVNDELEPVTPLRITVGDEYQGCFAGLGDGVRAALRMRLLLAPLVDARHGLGWGEVRVLSRRPRVEDGSAWWAARDAIEEAAHLATKAGSRSVRTAFRLPREADPLPPYDDTLAAAVNAALQLRDELVAGLDESGRTVLRGLLEGRTQRQVADDLGVTSSAVSQRVRRGIGAVLRAEALLAAL